MAVKKDSVEAVQSEESRFEKPACHDMSLSAEELNCVESLEFAAAE
jgi:hypothetical protein